MGGLRQITAVTLLNLRTVPQRLGSEKLSELGDRMEAEFESAMGNGRA